MTTLKTAAFAIALTLAPTLSFAMGCSSGHSQQAMSCAEGSTYDTETRTCVPVTT